MSMKNPMTPAGIETATLRFVAQNLNHCATAIPSSVGGGNNKNINFDSVLGCVATCVSELCHTSKNILSPSFPAISTQ